VKGACDGVQLGNLSTLLNKIQPSVYREKTITESRTSKNDAFVGKVTEMQVRRSVEQVIEGSVILREMIEKGEIYLIGGHYSVETGEVEFFEDTLHGAS
jgi:carbonic anhydrase